jgi:pilus assembly protein FimV
MAHHTMFFCLTPKRALARVVPSLLLVALGLGVTSNSAWALMLGRSKVLSALGEPLRVEVDVLDISADESATLRAGIASAEVFKSAGINFNPVLNGLQVTLQRRTDGSAFLSVSGSTPVNESFVDVMLELNWNGGRQVRDYTLLLDPPQITPPPVEPVQAQTPVTSTAPTASSTSTPPQQATQPIKPAAPSAASKALVKAATKAQIKSPANAAGDAQVKVIDGDTAGKIARDHQISGFSLDQMLVAMQKANPEAFINKNINRLRSGVILNLPTGDQASENSAEEARDIIQAQSKDFNSYREKLAASARTSKQDAPNRGASGSIQTQVQDKKSADAAPDKLTLSKGALGSNVADQVAEKLIQQEQAQKARELSKNLADLEKLSKETQATLPNKLANSQANNETKPSSPITASTTASSTASSTAPTASAAPSAPSDQLTAIPAISGAASSTTTPKSSTDTPPASASNEEAAEAEGLDRVLNDPMTPLVAGGLISALFGLGVFKFIRARARRNADDNPLLSPPSGAGGSDSGADDANSSALKEVKKSIALSQADIMLTYGREAQAILLLKSAIEQEPERTELHLKLAGIYAKSEQVAEFEQVALQVQAVTGGPGADWAALCTMGQALDSQNPLYFNGVTPMPLAAETPDSYTEPEQDDAPEDPPEVAPEKVNTRVEEDIIDKPPMDNQSLEDMLNSLPDMDLNTSDLDSADLEAEVAEQAATPAAEPLEFDMSAISLDLAVPSSGEAANSDQQAFETKLALAEEFNAIGDVEGARTMIEDIIAQASGEMKAKAEEALSKLG